MNELDYFGDCLQDLLIENKITVKDLSESTGICLSRLYDFIGKKHLPSLSNAIKIADYFLSSLDFLFGFDSQYTKRNYKIIDSPSSRVKKAIDDSKMSRYQICKSTKIDESQLLRWYSGQQIPTLVSLINLAKFFNCSLDYLAGRE